MKYYLDTEFLEGKQDKQFLGIKYGETKPTIDLISIGIVCEDGREYYAISKDFNLYEAWNRHEDKIEIMSGDARNLFPEGRKYKEYWIRENVLRPIYYEMIGKDINFHDYDKDFSYSNLKKLIKLKGKTNKQIAEEIKSFCEKTKFEENEDGRYIIGTDISNATKKGNIVWDKPNFYAYYADYDWVVFCQLFGTMMDLPKGFPMYAIDLKQEMDNIVNSLLERENKRQDFLNQKHYTFEEGLSLFKTRKNYPKQANEHNALADARWNKELHQFLEN